MRTKTVLMETFENIKLLSQYLYMSEEHKVVIHNSIGVPLELSMDEKLNIWCKNLNFENVPPMLYNSEFSPATCDTIVELLKEEPALQPELFSNRWEEIEKTVKVNLSLNALHV